jgi:hypothetical protein
LNSEKGLVVYIIAQLAYKALDKLRIKEKGLL